MSFKISAATNVGSVRSRNEDCLGFTGTGAIQDRDRVLTEGISELPLLAVVADGLGGHPCGDQASRMAVAVLLDRSPVDGASMCTAIRAANMVLIEHSAMVPECRGLGTTLAAVLIADHHFVVANVGDSRVYVIEDALPLTLLSTDDSSSIAPDLLGFPSGGVTRILGGSDHFGVARPHLYEATWTARTRLLLCTDGLSSYVPAAEIATTLRAHRGIAAVRALIAQALDAGGRDNVTVTLVEIA